MPDLSSLDAQFFAPPLTEVAKHLWFSRILAAGPGGVDVDAKQLGKLTAACRTGIVSPATAGFI
jgi:hypothetical protein